MNRAEFLAYHKVVCDKMHAICQAKNADYTGGQGNTDAFANFRIVESMGIASTEQGMLTRMSDKMARLASYVKQGKLMVKDESVEDTLLDLANYCILMAGYLGTKGKPQEASALLQGLRDTHEKIQGPPDART